MKNPVITLEFYRLYELHRLPDPTWLNKVYPWMGTFNDCLNNGVVACVGSPNTNLEEPDGKVMALRRVVYRSILYATATIDGQEWRLTSSSPPTHVYGKPWLNDAQGRHDRYEVMRSAKVLGEQVKELIFLRSPNMGDDNDIGWNL